jgi:hypothetical protein
MIGAGVIAARRGLPLVSRAMTSTGNTIRSIFDGTWVSSFVSGTQTITAYLEASLPGWSGAGGKAEQLAQRLIAAAANETEAATMLALNDILATTNWNQIQRDFMQETAMNALRGHRGQIGTMSIATVIGHLETGAQLNMRAMQRGVNAIQTHISADLTGNFTAEQIRALARALAALDNAEDTAIRAAVQQELGVAANAIPTRLVRRLRHQMFSGYLTAFAHAADYGIQQYGSLHYQLRNSTLDVQVHHLFEQRFAPALQANERQMLSIVLTPQEHQAFTNAWRTQIGYVGDTNPITTANATPQQIRNAAREVYRDYPDILRALGL